MTWAKAQTIVVNSTISQRPRELNLALAQPRLFVSSYEVIFQKNYTKGIELVSQRC